jgi:hypothetical protein
MEAAKDIGLVLLALVACAVAAVACFDASRKYAQDLHSLHQIARGRVPSSRILKNRILWLLIIVVVAVMVVFPAMDHMERKSPLHQAVKPLVETKLRSDADAQALIGGPMSFGNEESWSYNSESGDMSFKVSGSKAKGEVYVKAKKVDGAWRPITIDLQAGSDSVSIPAQ